MKKDLIGAWKAWEEERPPFVLPEDRLLIQDALDSKAAVVHDWNTCTADPSFGDPSERRFHVGLLPMPFVGNLNKASVYVLLLNPGLGPHDYYGEYKVPEYKAAAIANLRQEREVFMFLDPKFSWHGGFAYWHGKLASLIQELAGRASFASARAHLARSLACIELIPYHSPSFRDPGRWVRSLPSALIAKQFVQEVVMQRVQAGQAVVVVARKGKIWELPKHEGIVVYEGAEARSAHLTPNSRGGRLILDHLARG